MATCAISGVLQDPSGTAVVGAVVKAKIVSPYFSTTIEIVPTEISTTSAASTGAWSLTLIQGASAIFTILYPPNATDSRRVITHSVAVPLTTTANFSDLATEGLG